MLKFFSFILLLFFTDYLQAQGKVVATINNLKNNHGVCRACLFSNEASFASLGQPNECVVVGVKNKSAKAVFSNVQAGCYAVFVFHDMNNNNKMDRNFLGVPKEGYGASNNKLPFAAAPHFDENKFDVYGNNIILLNIHLRNVF